MELDSHTIYITCNCNFRCKYCYETNKTDCSLSLHDAENIFRRIIDMSKNNILIELFGGEPLLNWPVIEFFLSPPQRDNFRIKTIVSNGYLLTEKMISKIIDSEAHIRLSYDGRNGHDLCRINNFGNGTERRVYNSIAMCVDTGISFGINFALHKYNEEYCVNDVKELLDLGVSNIWIYPVKRNDFAPQDFTDKFLLLRELASIYGATLGTGSQYVIRKKYVHTAVWFKNVPPYGASWKDEQWRDQI